MPMPCRDTHIISEGGHLHPSAVANRVASQAAAAIALQLVSEDKDAILDTFDEEVVMVVESSTWWEAFLESKEDGQNTRVVLFLQRASWAHTAPCISCTRMQSAGRPPNHAGYTCHGGGLLTGNWRRHPRGRMMASRGFIQSAPDSPAAGKCRAHAGRKSNLVRHSIRGGGGKCPINWQSLWW